MLSREQNDLLAGIRPGMPMGVHPPELQMNNLRLMNDRVIPQLV